MPHLAPANPAAPATCPVAVPLASIPDTTAAPVVGTIVNVAGSHPEALQYADNIFRFSPVVSDTHGGHLKLQGLLAQGSWSVVYRVTELVQRKNFALKVIPQQGAHITSYYEDARKLAKLRHPNIIEVYDHFVFKEEDSPCPLLCIRMELCKFSLEQYIRHKRHKESPILTTTICVYISEMASALAYLHQQGLLHGDVSSANVLLAPGASASGPLAVRLTNFGSSQRTGKSGSAPLTVTGGSRAYVPPEWVHSTTSRRPLTALETPLPSYDLWGLGCVLGELATMKLVPNEWLNHGDSLASDPCCLAALKREMATVHDGSLADLCYGLLEMDPDERLSAEAVPAHLPAAQDPPSTPRAKHTHLGLRHSSHVSGLLRPLGLLRRH